MPGGRFWLHCSAHAATSDAADWRAVEYRVAVVQSRQDQTAGQCLCQIGRQLLVYMADGLCMKIAASHCCQIVYNSSRAVSEVDFSRSSLIELRLRQKIV